MGIPAEEIARDVSTAPTVRVTDFRIVKVPWCFVTIVADPQEAGVQMLKRAGFTRVASGAWQGRRAALPREFEIER